MSETKTNTIGKEFTLLELIGFVAAPIITRLMVSLLTTLDDALFVSRFCGQNALAAFSILFPWFMLVDALGMLMLSVVFAYFFRAVYRHETETVALLSAGVP